MALSIGTFGLYVYCSGSEESRREKCSETVTVGCVLLS